LTSFGSDSIDYAAERLRMVERYVRMGYVRTGWMEKALKKVPRELFMPRELRRYAYEDEPYPIPGDGRQTISAPYTYALFYEPLELRRGDRFLEVGMGSGYGAALAYEVIGEEGLVVTVEINEETYRFGKGNLLRAGYGNVVTVLGDGSKGYPPLAPYDKICVTAACPRIPNPLRSQLKAPGRLVAPVGPLNRWLGQDLTLLMKDENGRIQVKKLSKVVYVPLQGEFGWSKLNDD
jgi:protein-L-isoaspartate(D-aspartate) O-methyltransferase